MDKPMNDAPIISAIKDLIYNARNNVVKSVNQIMVRTYYAIGQMIVEEEQKGNKRAEYGQKLLEELSKSLINEFGKGFSTTNLKQMRQFYLTYSNRQTVSDDFRLSWSHYLKLMRIDDEDERSFYEIESHKNNWSIRELRRQFDSALYTRLALARNAERIKELSEKGLIIEKPQDAIKDPYILEFVGLPDNVEYSESELEQEIINKLEHFLLELGKGFTFVARQKRISFDDRHFKIDLVFYNRILRCFVLIDLKVGEVKHQDLGQMQMYVNFYDRKIRLPNEKRTIGIVLCKDKNQSVVEYTLPENNEHIFASKYQTVLPSKENLKQILESSESNN